ncbi:MAG: hypothetical protein HQL84_03755 [Magnetococcales bacterium]|nr:hypothetical protein [Magnetococcales bacterium]MBF0173214.1 hypothetical protein [Magnetococcales bacterium]MBF0348927.1 hypothetical protein [Magnetococcales bacterium]MBF0632865.1 hypothetical protein [Magnetococcales bacterium]
MNFPETKPIEKSALVLGLTMILMVSGGPVLAEGGNSKGLTDASPEVKPLREFIYYPNYAQSPYNYQSTGDFARTPMVIPSSVAVIQQPSEIIVDVPPPLPPPPPVAVGGLEMPPPPVAMGTPVPRGPLGNGPAMVGMQPPPGHGFSLHVGSSMDATHADLLLQQVTGTGIPAYRRPMSYNGLTWEQIHAGPFDSYEKVTQVAKMLQDRLQIQGRIVTH